MALKHCSTMVKTLGLSKKHGTFNAGTFASASMARNNLPTVDESGGSKHLDADSGDADSGEGSKAATGSDSPA